MLTYVLLRVLHVATVATWFGLVLGWPAMLKRGQKGGPDAFRLAVDETHRRLKMTLVFGGVTIVTGLIIIFHMGGFGAVHRNVHMGLGIVIVALAVQLFVTRPAVGALQNAVERAPEDVEGARPSIVKIAASSGVFQLLWLVTLVLMIWR